MDPGAGCIGAPRSGHESFFLHGSGGWDIHDPSIEKSSVDGIFLKIREGGAMEAVLGCGLIRS